jgi:hypothetical protein
MLMLMTDTALIKQFVYGGRATFTLRGRSHRYTYKVETNDAGLYFVRVLVSPDVWAYAGIIRGGVFNTTAKSSISLDAPSIVALRWFLQRLHAPVPTFPGMEFWHEGKCCRCGRPLTDPESIAKGIGPVCEAA